MAVVGLSLLACEVFEFGRDSGVRRNRSCVNRRSLRSTQMLMNVVVDEKKKLTEELAEIRARLELYRQQRPFRETLPAKTERAESEPVKDEA